MIEQFLRFKPTRQVQTKVVGANPTGFLLKYTLSSFKTRQERSCAEMI